MSSETSLRSTVQHQRALIATLRSTISAAPLLQLLGFASSQLDIVEHCLSKDEMARNRSPAELAWWLDQTANLLSAATTQTKYVEDIVAKYGTDVRAF